MDNNKNVRMDTDNGSFATNIMRICGIKEEWTKQAPWISDKADLRANLVAYIIKFKNQIVRNVIDNIEAQKAVGKVTDYLDRLKNGK